jgi:hypothetical protein
MKSNRISAAALIAGAIVIASTTAGRAALLDFDFTFTDDPSLPGTIPGTVKGEIEGLMNNTANQAAAAVLITSVTGISLPFALPLNTVGDVASNINYFTVTNGKITSVEYDASSLNYQLLLDLDKFGTLYTLFGVNEPIENKRGLAGLNITPVNAAVPEPGAITLLGTALAGLGLFRFRANRRARVA